MEMKSKAERLRLLHERGRLGRGIRHGGVRYWIGHHRQMGLLIFDPHAQREVETGKVRLFNVTHHESRLFMLNMAGTGSLWSSPGDQGARTDLVRIAEQLTASAPRAEPTAEGLALTRPVETAIRSYIGEQGGALGEEIERCFGVDAGSRLVREGLRCARIQLRHAVEGVSEPAEHELTFDDEGWRFLSTFPDGIRIRGDRYRRLFARLLIPRQGSQNVRFRQTWDAVEALALAVLPDPRPAFYLPADRTGLMNAHRAIVSALIRSATMASIRGADAVPTLSGVRGDFLEQLVETVSDRRQRPRRERLEELGKHIEDGILRGAVKVGTLPGVAYPHFTYRPSGWESDLPLTNTSSMVSELAPVVLYLRGVAVRTGRERQRLDGEGDRPGCRYRPLSVGIRRRRGGPAQRLGRDRRTARGRGVNGFADDAVTKIAAAD